MDHRNWSGYPQENQGYDPYGQYRQPQYQQQSYPQQDYQQPSYPQQDYQQPYYPQEDYQQPYYPQEDYQQPYYPQEDYQQPSYPQQDYQQSYYPQENYQQPSYPQQDYQQPYYPQENYGQQDYGYPQQDYPQPSDPASVFPPGYQPPGTPFPPQPAAAGGAEKERGNSKALPFVATAAVAVLLIVAIVAGFFLFKEKDEKVFYGSWNASVNATKDFKEGIGDEVSPYIGDYQFIIEYNFGFYEDGTYYLSVNEAAFNETVAALQPYMKQAIIDYFREEASLIGKSDEEISKLYQDKFHQSIDDLAAEYVGKIQYETFAQGINCSGKYKVKDHKLYLSGGLDKDIDESCYYKYAEISDTVISLDEYYVGGNYDSDVVGFTLEKQEEQKE